MADDGRFESDWRYRPRVYWDAVWGTPKDKEAAIAGYTEAIRLDPDYALAYAARSFAYGQLAADHDTPGSLLVSASVSHRRMHRRRSHWLLILLRAIWRSLRTVRELSSSRRPLRSTSALWRLHQAMHASYAMPVILPLQWVAKTSDSTRSVER